MLQKILERELGTGFASLPGTRIQGKLPIPSAVINQALKELIARKESPVKGVMVAFLDNNKAIAVIGLDKWPLPKQIELPFTIEPVVARDGKLLAVVHLESPGGVLGAALPVMLGLFANQPGLRAEGTTIELDLDQMAHHNGKEVRLGPLFKTCELRTRRGFVDLVFELAVEKSA